MLRRSRCVQIFVLKLFCVVRTARSSSFILSTALYFYPPPPPTLRQSVRSDMDAGRAAAGLPVADWSESHMVNVRLVVDVLIALGLVRSDYNTAEQAGGWPMDVHPPSEAHGG